MIHFRTAEPNEAELISDIAFKSKASLGYSSAFMGACRAELTYSTEQIRSDRYHFIIAEEERVCVGVVVVEILPHQECSIEALFVDPERKSIGIGSGLLKRALTWAIQNNLSGVHIQSDPAATGFYQSFGARQVGETASGSIPGRMLPQLFIDLNEVHVPL